MSQLKLQVAGIGDLRKGLRGIDKDLPKGVRLALNQVADVVVTAAKPGIPSRTGAAKASLKAASTQTAAKISAGGTRAPYYPWLDFGGAVGRGKKTRRQYIQGGRYIFPAVANNQDEIQRVMEKVMKQLGAANGIEVT